MRFVFRVDRMGAKVEIRGLAVGDEHIHRFERTLRDVVDNSALPVRIPLNGEEEDRSGLQEKLRAVFVSEQAITSELRPCTVKRPYAQELLANAFHLYRYSRRSQSENHSKAHSKASA